MQWINTTVGDFCSFVYGKAIKKQDQLERGVPVYGSNGIYTYSASQLVGPYSVIIGRKGSVGKLHISFKPCWVSDTAFYVKYESLEDAYFTYYLLSTLGLEDMNTDAAVPGLNRDNAHRLEVRIPESVADRKKLIEPLIVLDEKIQLNQQINQTLEQMAQAIFKSWFVDFEPIKAKIAALEAGGSEDDALLAAMQAISGKDPQQLTKLQTENPEHYNTLRTTAELFPAAMQESELEEIPEGWKVSQIGDEVTVVGGGTPSTKNPDFWEGGTINWTTPKDLSNVADKVLTDTDRMITQAGLNKISSGLLPVDTVLMSSRAPVGYLALAKVPVAVNQGYIAMKCEQTLSPEFIIQWCSTNMDEIKNRASGTTFAEISKKSFNVIPVLVPPLNLISAYSKHVKQTYLKIEMNVRENKSLGELRDTLLPKLLSGELSVNKDVD